MNKLGILIVGTFLISGVAQAGNYECLKVSSKFGIYAIDDLNGRRSVDPKENSIKLSSHDTGNACSLRLIVDGDEVSLTTGARTMFTLDLNGEPSIYQMHQPSADGTPDFYLKCQITSTTLVSCKLLSLPYPYQSGAFVDSGKTVSLEFQNDQLVIKGFYVGDVYGAKAR